ncbi:hypothetical protein [Kribbella speibonae]|uniref:Gram-positive cocci surface proteins LPxTG domain-containing protein n=1 Tax=Kribbella speibonae TaxID=1572660 RepID=A0A4R0IWH2_9ACTN|nr:hypothetical protein [Kribbella speibonae]TCC38333.1 hypothetical protein E0H92_18040 [Kribbella speibonae]
MTAPHLDLRRRPAKPAGNLFRVTAAVSFLSLPLFWAVYELYPRSGVDPCPEDAQEVCPPTLSEPVNELAVLLVVACVELLVIGGYLAFAAARRSLDLRSGLRWSPIAVTIVALAVGGFGWLIEGDDLRRLDSLELALLLLFAVWLLTPLVLYGVHRGDRRAVIPVVLALAPTGAGAAFVATDSPLAALPAVMLVVAVLTVLVVRRRE